VLLHSGRVLCVSAGLVALVSQTGGCSYGDVEQVLRSEVATSTECADVLVKPVPAYELGWKPGQYKVTGCGKDAVYNCKDEGGYVAFSSAKELCKVAEPPAPASSGGEAAPAAGPAAAAADDEPPPLEEATE
jgi:hypothetical protein